MTVGFSADLDAAITAASPSAFFASERRADRWHRPVGVPPADPAASANVLHERLRAAFGALRDAMREVDRVLARVARQIASAPPPAPPHHPVTRRRPQPPRTIDPAGGIQARPLGRAMYRPVR